jgi:hypothetical protein
MRRGKMAAEYHERVRESIGKELVGEYTTHITTHVLVGTKGTYIGVADCSNLDEYRKKTGEDIARGRAEKAMAIAHGWLESDDGCFKDVCILTPSGDLIKGQIWVPSEVDLEIAGDPLEISNVA